MQNPEQWQGQPLGVPDTQTQPPAYNTQAPYPQQPYPQQPYPQQPQAPYPQQPYPQQPYPQAPMAAAPPGTQLAPAQVQYIPQTQTTIIYETRAPRTVESFKGREAMILGIVQLVIASLCIVFNIVGLVMQSHRIRGTYYYYYTYYNGSFSSGSGFWAAIFFIVAGGLAIGAGRQKRYSVIVATMIMSIFASVFAVVLMGYSGSAVHTEDLGVSRGYFRNDDLHRTSMAMGALLLILALGELAISITVSAFCCRAVCCGSQSQTNP